MKNSIVTLFTLLVTVAFTGYGTVKATGNEPDGQEKDQKAINLTKAQFLEKVFNYEKNSEEWNFEGDIPCIVDFYADWCQPCKIAGPILEELAVEYEGKIHVYKVDTDKERELAAAFGISSIPAFLLCPIEGKPQLFRGIDQTKEATKERFRKAIDEVLLQSQGQE